MKRKGVSKKNKKREINRLEKVKKRKVLKFTKRYKEMFVFLSKKIGMPNGTKIGEVCWNKE